MTATVVLANGTHATGEITEWFGPGECAVQPDWAVRPIRGVLLEAWQRAQARAAAAQT